MNSKIRTVIIASFFSAIVCVMTLIVKIPSPLNGYINLGDCAVLVSGWTLPCGYGFLAAAIGSMLADLFSGYVIYAPATFIIKGAMALIVFGCLKLLNKKTGKLASQIIGALLAEITMVCGYFVFEGFLYGFAPSSVNIPANAVQGTAGIILGIILIKVFEKIKLTDR